MDWGYENIFEDKSQTKIDKIHKDFWTTSGLQVYFFCPKMSDYSQCIYYSQAESTHFGLRILTNFVLKNLSLKNQWNVCISIAFLKKILSNF